MKYEQYEQCMKEGIDISSVVNDYIHLLHDHNSDQQFEDILRRLLPCQIRKCRMYRRNYRDRNEEKRHNNKQDDLMDVVIEDILTKIHCYFMHTDVGHRLAMREKTEIQRSKGGEEDKHKDEYYLRYI